MLMLNYYMPEGIDVMIYSARKCYSYVVENNKAYVVVFCIFTMTIVV